LPAVYFLCVLNFCVSHHLSAVTWHVSMIFTDLLPLQGHQFLVSRPPLPEEGPLPRG
jgi:hypothetical protein